MRHTPHADRPPATRSASVRRAPERGARAALVLFVLLVAVLALWLPWYFVSPGLPGPHHPLVGLWITDAGPTDLRFNPDGTGRSYRWLNDREGNAFRWRIRGGVLVIAHADHDPDWDHTWSWSPTDGGRGIHMRQVTKKFDLFAPQVSFHRAARAPAPPGPGHPLVGTWANKVKGTVDLRLEPGGRGATVTADGRSQPLLWRLRGDTITLQHDSDRDQYDDTWRYVLTPNRQTLSFSPYTMSGFSISIIPPPSFRRTAPPASRKR